MKKNVVIRVRSVNRIKTMKQLIDTFSTDKIYQI